MTRASAILLFGMALSFVHAIGRAQERPASDAKQRLFVLTPADQASLDAILDVWQASCEKVQTLRGNVEVWTDHPVSRTRKHRSGTILYRRPDCAAYHVEFDVSGKKPRPLGEDQEHWVWNNKSMFHLSYADKLLTEFPNDPEQSTYRLVDNPIPALFHVDIAEFKRRYFVREMTTAEERARREFWLQVVPKSEAEAAAVPKFELILNEVESGGKKLTLPFALKRHFASGGSESVVLRTRDLAEWTELPCSHLFRPDNRLKVVGWKHEIARHSEELETLRRWLLGPRAPTDAGNPAPE